MNPPLSAAAPAIATPKPARARNADIEEPEPTYRPAHAAHARPATHDPMVLDLTDAAPGKGDAEDMHADVADAELVDVVDSILVLVDDTTDDETGVGHDDPVIDRGPATPVEPLIGARAAARSARRRRTRSGDTVADAADAAGGVQWSSTSGDTDTEPDVAAPATADTTDDGTTDTERDPLGLIRAIETAWTASSSWLRRNATAQLAVPFVVIVSVGLLAVVAAEGATQRIGQIVVTAALVTGGVAWAQALGDQRRRQHDLRFRLASGNLERADLTGTVLDGFTLWGQNLRGAKLSGCSADHVLLSGADLREASLTGASLRVASLAGADLSNARLFRADLRGADLSGAIAVSSSFEGAVLRGALLEGADLGGADLSGADLRGATHDERTNWDGVIVSDDTHLPEDVPALHSHSL